MRATPRNTAAGRSVEVRTAHEAVAAWTTELAPLVVQLVAATRAPAPMIAEDGLPAEPAFRFDGFLRVGLRSGLTHDGSDPESSGLSGKGGIQSQKVLRTPVTAGHPPASEHRRGAGNPPGPLLRP